MTGPPQLPTNVGSIPQIINMPCSCIPGQQCPAGYSCIQDVGGKTLCIPSNQTFPEGYVQVSCNDNGYNGSDCNAQLQACLQSGGTNCYQTFNACMQGNNPYTPPPALPFSTSDVNPWVNANNRAVAQNCSQSYNLCMQAGGNEATCSQQRRTCEASAYVDPSSGQAGAYMPLSVSLSGTSNPSTPAPASNPPPAPTNPPATSIGLTSALSFLTDNWVFIAFGVAIIVIVALFMVKKKK